LINRLQRELQFTAFISTDQHVKSLRYSRDSLEFFRRITKRQELRPLFAIRGIEPDGRLSVTEEFREEVLSLAKQILPQLLD